MASKPQRLRGGDANLSSLRDARDCVDLAVAVLKSFNTKLFIGSKLVNSI